MVPGLNSNVDRNGAIFHVQTEDLGRSKPILQTLVYYGGEVVTVLEYTYEALATSAEFSAEEVRRKLARQHHRLIAEIDAGIFDGVDPAAIAAASEDELRQRQRILDYLESALTYDVEPCPAPDKESGEASEVEPEAAIATSPETLSEVARETPADVATEATLPVAAASEEGTKVESAAGEATEEAPLFPTIAPHPAIEAPVGPVGASPAEHAAGGRSGASVGTTPGPRRLVVIRPERDTPSEPETPNPAHELETPQVIPVMQTEEAPAPVPVRQVVPVKIVSKSEGGVDEILGRLDETVERQVRIRRPSRGRRWLVAAASLVALASIAFGWRWFSGESDSAAPASASASVANAPAGSEIVDTRLARTRPEEAARPEPAAPVPVASPAAEPRSPRPDPPVQPRVTNPKPSPPVTASRQRIETTPEPKNVAPVVETAAATAPRARPEPEPTAPAAETPPPAAPVEQSALADPQVAPPVASSGAAGETASEGEETEATLTPSVPEIPSAAPDPLENLSPKTPPAAALPEPPEERPAPKPRVRPGMLVDLASVDSAPEPTVRGFPEYPKKARKQGRQGQVELDLLIDDKGNVAEVRVADGGVVSDLSDAAIEAARAWKYRPARKGAYKVRVWKPVTVHFVLDEHNQSRVRVEE